MFRLVLAVALLATALLPLNTWGLEKPPALRSLVGEDLEFRIRWGVIPAGKATLRVLDAGDGRVRFRAEARTLPYIDTVFPVRDQIESTFLPAESRVLRYYKRSKEGWGRMRETEVLFSAADRTARYFRDGELRKTLLVPPGVQDPLSCFFAYRTLDLPEDREARLEVTDGKKLVTSAVRVLGRETVETPAGVFPTVVVEPSMEGIGGIFRKSPGARILVWLTDDEWRRPVKLQSEVSIGSFTAEIVKVDGPATLPRDPR